LWFVAEIQSTAQACRHIALHRHRLAHIEPLLGRPRSRPWQRETPHDAWSVVSRCSTAFWQSRQSEYSAWTPVYRHRHATTRSTCGLTIVAAILWTRWNSESSRCFGALLCRYSANCPGVHCSFFSPMTFSRS